MSKPTPPAKIEYDQRFILRPVEPADIHQIEKATLGSIHELYTYMHWSHKLQGRQQLFDRVVTQWMNYFSNHEFEMALFDKATGEFLVYTGFYPTARINPNCYEIGYWTVTEHKGKGYATLATQMQIALIFEYFKGDRIEITCSIENRPSLAVIKKCNFHFEGTLRNFYPQGTDEMFSRGYTRERTASLFSLIPEDRPSLPWYSDLVQKLVVYPVLDPPFSLGA
jgi:RimJ/RimL family protein N-acetyltransferase